MAAPFWHRLRETIAARIGNTNPVHGEIETDASYFDGERKGKPGRGAGGKAPVFDILKHRGRVHAKTISNARAKTLMPITLMPIIKLKCSLKVFIARIRLATARYVLTRLSRLVMAGHSPSSTDYARP